MGRAFRGGNTLSKNVLVEAESCSQGILMHGLNHVMATPFAHQPQEEHAMSARTHHTLPVTPINRETFICLP